MVMIDTTKENLCASVRLSLMRGILNITDEQILKMIYDALKLYEHTDIIKILESGVKNNDT